MKWLVCAAATVAVLLTVLRRNGAVKGGTVYWDEPEEGIQYDVWPAYLLQTREYSSMMG